MITATQAGLVSCEGCARLYPRDDLAGPGGAHCGVCGSAVHARKPGGLSRTWALLAAAIICYIPANLFPVMTIIFSGQGAPSTIMGGVIELFDGGDWPIALLILFASITVPLAKIVGLAYLAYSVMHRSQWSPRKRTRMYKIIAAIGRWSMIDMFMVAILVAIVRLGAVATVEPGLGALAFAATVVITIFAAEGFDPRLVWDSMEEDR